MWQEGHSQIWDVLTQVGLLRPRLLAAPERLEERAPLGTDFLALVSSGEPT